MGELWKRLQFSLQSIKSDFLCGADKHTDTQAVRTNQNLLEAEYSNRFLYIFDFVIYILLCNIVVLVCVHTTMYTKHRPVGAVMLPYLHEPVPEIVIHS